MFGLISAMPEECDALVQALVDPSQETAGGRIYHSGLLFGKKTTIVFSRWGKVAAATTATHLITKFDVKTILFTGVAGAVAPNLAVGDVVIGERLIQHDMDATPLFQRYEIPLLGHSYFKTSVSLRNALSAAVNRFFSNDLEASVAMDTLQAFRINKPSCYEGGIASGDKFFADKRELDDLRRALPEILCVEMEGAAVAQACFEYNIPFGIIRTISDSADEGAPIDFSHFVGSVASCYSLGIVRNFLAFD